MDRVRDHEPKNNPAADILNDVNCSVHSKLWWLDGWLRENLTEEQKAKLAADYETGLR